MTSTLLRVQRHLQPYRAPIFLSRSRNMSTDEAKRTQSLKSRTPSAEEKKVIDNVLSLYQCHPTDESYSSYDKTAEFVDPVSIAKGLERIKAQFNGMPKLFQLSETKECTTLEDDTLPPKSIRFDLLQHYQFQSAASGAEKTLRSLITLTRNDQGLITRHEERWDHEPNAGEEGSTAGSFMTSLSEARRKAGASLIDKMVTSDPNKV